MTQRLAIVPPLDPDFRPAVLAMRGAKGVRMEVALERSPDSISHAACEILGHFRFLKRWVKFLLWSRAAHRIHFAGPKELCEQLRRHAPKRAANGIRGLEIPQIS